MPAAEPEAVVLTAEPDVEGAAAEEEAGRASPLEAVEAGGLAATVLMMTVRTTTVEEEQCLELSI